MYGKIKGTVYESFYKAESQIYNAVNYRYLQSRKTDDIKTHALLESKKDDYDGNHAK